MQPSVHLASATDVNDLIALVKESHLEESTIPIAFNPNAVFATVLRALRGEAVIGVISNDTEIESACFLEVTKPWYSQTSIVLCLFFYTRANYRKSTNSKVLLSWARTQAERLNCPLHIEVPMLEGAKPKLNLFERILGSPGGIGFVHNPHIDAPQEAPATEVQVAQPSDEDRVIDVVRELGRENAAYAPDEDMAISLIHETLRGDGLVGLIRPNGDIEGIIMLRLNTPWFSNEPFLDEWLAFVPDRYRKSQNAKSLIQFAKRQSDRLNLSLRIGIVSKIELTRKRDLYQRLLGEPAIYSFLYRPM
jgi:hypothetical protein